MAQRALLPGAAPFRTGSHRPRDAERRDAGTSVQLFPSGADFEPFDVGASH